MAVDCGWVSLSSYSAGDLPLGTGPCPGVYRCPSGHCLSRNDLVSMLYCCLIDRSKLTMMRYYTDDIALLLYRSMLESRLIPRPSM